MTHSHSDAALLRAFLDTTVNEIIPRTRAGVAAGCKVFGAACVSLSQLIVSPADLRARRILDKKTLRPYQVATNDETASPLLASCCSSSLLHIADPRSPAARRDQLHSCAFASSSLIVRRRLTLTLFSHRTILRHPSGSETSSKGHHLLRYS